MISEIMNKAILDIDVYYTANASLKNNKDFADNLIKLSMQLEALKRILLLDEYITSQGLNQDHLLSGNGKTGLLELLAECGQKVEARNLEFSFVTQLAREINSMASQQKENWPHTATAYAGNVPESLRNMSALLKETEKANAVQEMILKLQTRWPIARNDITLFIAKVKEGQSLLDTLQINDPEVDEFITKLRLQQTTISDLNDNILSWIRKNHLESRIKIGFVTR